MSIMLIEKTHFSALFYTILNANEHQLRPYRYSIRNITNLLESIQEKNFKLYNERYEIKDQTFQSFKPIVCEPLPFIQALKIVNSIQRNTLEVLLDYEEEFLIDLDYNLLQVIVESLPAYKIEPIIVVKNSIPK